MLKYLDKGIISNSRNILEKYLNISEQYLTIFEHCENKHFWTLFWHIFDNSNNNAAQSFWKKPFVEERSLTILHHSIEQLIKYLRHYLKM